MNVCRTLVQAGATILLSIAMLGHSAIPAAAAEMLVVRNVAEPGLAEIHYTEEELKALPQVTIRTQTEFTDGVATFVGPLVRDVIAPLDTGKGTTLHLVAANAYAVDIPISDMKTYDVILAMSANGNRLSLRDKGPLWLMYPMDDHPELKASVYNARLIWQLILVEIQ
jgi:hypothetical protein